MINIFRKMWSKKQIKEIISDSSSEVVESLQNQDLKVKTIEQSQANWALSLEEQTISVPTGITPSWSYGRLEIINGLLCVVISLKLENTTGSSVALGNLLRIDIDIPEELANKIYDYSGTPLSENGTPKAYICSAYGFYSDGEATSVNAGGQIVLGRYNDLSSNKNKITLYGRSQPNVPANSTIYYDFRIFLTLI